jgi:type II secretory pathway component GspD/PulD (secretin)
MDERKIIILLIITLLLTFYYCLLLPTKVNAKDIKYDQIKFDLKQYDIVEFCGLMAAYLDKNIIVSSDVQGQVNIRVTKGIDTKNGYQFLLDTLSVYGYGAVVDNETIYVMPEAQLSRRVGGTIEPEYLSMENIDKIETEDLDRLISLNGNISQVGKNGLIVLETPQKKRQIKKIIQSIEEKNKTLTFIYELENISAIYATETLADVFEFQLKIVADDNNSLLLITCNQANIEQVKNIIKKLDIKEKQVYIESLIVEVDSSAEKQFGIDWGLTKNSNDQNYSIDYKNINNQSDLGLTSFLRSINGEITISGLIKLFTGIEGINIVSRPQLMTSNHLPARVTVGQNIPYITSLNTTDSQQDYTNYEYKDVATTLEIVPHIRNNKNILLEIKSTIQRLKNNSQAGTPETYKREISSTINILSGEVVVIGGVVGTDRETSKTGIPYLMDIPYIGGLFGYESEKAVETTMYVFVSAYDANETNRPSIYLTKKKTIDKKNNVDGFSTGNPDK